MTSGHHELKLAAAGHSEDRNRLLLAVTTRISLKLFLDPIMPVGRVHSPEQGFDDVLLILVVEPADVVRRAHADPDVAVARAAGEHLPETHTALSHIGETAGVEGEEPTLLRVEKVQ